MVWYDIGQRFRNYSKKIPIFVSASLMESIHSGKRRSLTENIPKTHACRLPRREVCSAVSRTASVYHWGQFSNFSTWIVWQQVEHRFSDISLNLSLFWNLPCRLCAGGCRIVEGPISCRSPEQSTTFQLIFHQIISVQSQTFITISPFQEYDSDGEEGGAWGTGGP